MHPIPTSFAPPQNVRKNAATLRTLWTPKHHRKYYIYHSQTVKGITIVAREEGGKCFNLDILANIFYLTSRSMTTDYS